MSEEGSSRRESAREVRDRARMDLGAVLTEQRDRLGLNYAQLARLLLANSSQVDRETVDPRTLAKDISSAEHGTKDLHALHRTWALALDDADLRRLMADLHVGVGEGPLPAIVAVHVARSSDHRLIDGLLTHSLCGVAPATTHESPRAYVEVEDAEDALAIARALRYKLLRRGLGDRVGILVDVGHGWPSSTPAVPVSAGICLTPQYVGWSSPAAPLTEARSHQQARSGATTQKLLVDPAPQALRREVAHATALVGRDDDHATILAAIEDAADTGRPALIDVQGESGIGKTALVREACSSLPKRFDVIWEDLTSATTYFGLAELLVEPLLDASSREYLRSLLRWPAHWLTQAVPTVAAALGPSFGSPSPGPVADAPVLCAAVAEMIAERSRDRPLVLVVDDFHLAQTAEQLVAAFSRASPAHVAVVCICQKEGPRTPELLASIRDAHRRAPAAGVMRSIDLDPLDEHDCRSLAEKLVGHRIDARSAGRVLDRSGGNPAYIVELARHDGLLDDRPSLPRQDELRDAIAHRTSRLSAPARDLLGLVAAFDGPVGQPHLRDAAERALLESFQMPRLVEIEEAGLLTTDGGVVKFRHGLVREAVYEALTSARRSLLHRAAAQALLAGAPVAGDERPLLQLLASSDAPAFEDPELDAEIVRVALSVAEAALERGDRETAIERYGTAIGRLRADSDEGLDIVLRRGLALQASGVEDTAVELFRLVIRIVVDRPTPVADRLFAGAALGLAGPLQQWPVVRGPRPNHVEIVNRLGEAAARLGAEDADLHRRVVARRVLEQCLVGAASPAERVVVERSIDDARSSGDDFSLAWAMVTELLAWWSPDDDLDQRIQRAQRLRSAAEAAGETVLVGWAIGFQMLHHLEQAEVDLFDELLDDLADVVSRWNLEHGDWAVESFRALRALLDSRFNDVDRHAYESMRHWTGSTSRLVFDIQRILAAREMGRRNHFDNPIVTGALDRAKAGHPLFVGGRALMHLVQGDDDGAHRLLDELGGSDFEGIERTRDWLPTMCMIAEVVAALGDVDRARGLHRLLEPFADRVAIIPLTVGCLGSVSRYLGIMAATIATSDPSFAGMARSHLEHAVLVHRDRLQSDHLTAHALVDLAWLEAGAGEDDAARAALDRARSLAARCRATAVDQRIELIATAMDAGRPIGPWVHDSLLVLPATDDGRRNQVRRRLVARAVPGLVRAAVKGLIRGRGPTRGDTEALSERVQAEIGARLSAEFQVLGGAFLKLGQLLNSAPGLFPPAFVEPFRSCLDAAAPLPFDQVREVVEASLGDSLGSLFEGFSETPIASGSIAVVHRAWVEGQPVAVKVVRPGIREVIGTDLAVIERFVTRLRGQPIAAPLLTIVRALREQLSTEVDMQIEAENMDRFRFRYRDAGLDRLVIPSVDHARSSSDVLTMDYLSGVPIDDESATSMVDDSTAVQQLLRAWFITALEDGSFHGDLHAGNLLVMPDARLGLLDWGVLGHLDPFGRLMLEHILRGSLDDDLAPWRAVAAIYREADLLTYEGWGLSEDEAALIVRNQMRPVLTSPLREVDLDRLVVTPNDIKAVLSTTGRDLGFIQNRQANRATRQRERRAQVSGARGSEIDLSSWMLAKQLIYVDGHLKRYMPDATIVDDRRFLQELLGDGPPAFG